MKRIIILSLVFLKLFAMEKTQIALCNLTPLSQTFIYNGDENPSITKLTLTPFSSHIITGSNSTGSNSKHYLHHTSLGKIVARHDCFKENMTIQGQVILILSSNHFSHGSPLKQWLSFDRYVSEQYMHDIDKRGTQAIVEHIIDPKNRHPLHPVYTGHTLLKEENLEPRSWAHNFQYCSNPTLLAILTVLVKWLPQRAQEQWNPYLMISKKYQELMHDVREKLYDKKEV